MTAIDETRPASHDGRGEPDAPKIGMMSRPQIPDPEDASGYWYARQPDSIRGVDVLNALRQYRSAEAEMRKRTRDSMGMGETDLLALRYLLRAQQQGRRMTPKELSLSLGISSASTTILVDRLQKSGHVLREKHPTDRRSIVIVATPASDLEVRDTLGEMHKRMVDIADRLDGDDAEAVFRFLMSMRDAVGFVDPTSHR
jgi:DNA-binding MarR family transcriptional regulator